MAKNLILGFTLGALVVILILVLTGKLVWSEPSAASDDTALLERNIAMHRPTIMELGGEEVLCLAITRQSGKKISVTHGFYVLKDGELKKLRYTVGDGYLPRMVPTKEKN